MRNLELDILKVHDLPIKSDIVKQLIETNDDTYILDGEVLRRVDSTEVIKDSITSLEFIKDENLLYAGDGNNFHWVNVAVGESGVIEIPDGYVAYKWNPSQDKIAVVDKNGYFSIFVLCPHRPPYAINPKYQLSVEERTNFIDIGWGSRSTQFRGSEGKTPGSKNNIYGCDVVPVDDQSVNIAWREDNEYLAISFIRDGQRTVKIFNHEGQYCFESDDRPGLSPQMAWKPNGSLLAVIQRQNIDHQSIYFFEKNGLYKSRISLPSSNEVKRIEWNNNILMLWHHDSDITHEISDEIYLWSWSNHRWYQKQSLIFKREDQVNYVAWHDKVWLKVITTQKLLRYRWKWVTHRSMYDLGAVLVIDGNDLNVTTLNSQIMPPPMYSYSQNFTKPINFLAIDSASNYVVVVLCDNTFILIRLTDSSLHFESGYKNTMGYKLPLATNHFVYDHSIDSFMYVESLDRSESQLIKFKFGTNMLSSNMLDSTAEITDFFAIDQTYCLAVCRESKLFLYEPIESPKLAEIGQYNISEGNMKCAGSNVKGKFINEKFYVFALINNTFYVNGIQVISNITSFLIFENLLALTAEEKMILCTLDEHSINLLKRKEWHMLNYRLIPNGALLVHGNPDTLKIVLQVPRGELEVVSPRMLSVCKIESLLAEKKYLDAYQIMHKDRINMNILYDLDPNAFYTNLNDIIKSINNCDYIDVFITQLTDKNVTEELYLSCFETRRLPIWTCEKKLVSILNQMVDVMLKIDRNYYLQSIITAFITMGTDDAYEVALLELLAAKEREKNGVEMRKPVEIVLKHAITISSVETLYKVALGMYNIDLIMWIAANSKFDPAEYIPFLKDLFNLDDPNYRNYKINCHIKRYEKALECLIQCNDVFDELEVFIKTYSLQKSILRHTTNRDNKYYALLTKIYCDYLESVGDHYQAGLLYLEVEDYHQAIESFIKSNKKDEVLATIPLLENEDYKDLTDIYERLAQHLLNHKYYSDASTIYCTYLLKKEDAISALVQGRLWIEAKMLCLELKVNHNIDRKIKPELMKCSHEMVLNIKSSEEEFNKLKKRLNFIRQEKLAQLRANNNMTANNIEHGIANLNFDLESIASTTQSQRTGTTNMTSNTSRRRKRIERKILQIREGSCFENVAIMRRLHILMTDMQNLAETLTHTCRSLLFVNSDYSLAKQLQSGYESLMNRMFSSVSEIWPDQMLNPPNPYTNESLIFLQNVEHLDYEYRFPPPDMRQKWKKLCI